MTVVQRGRAVLPGLGVGQARGHRAALGAIVASVALALVGCVGVGNANVPRAPSRSPGSGGTLSTQPSLPQRLEALQASLDPLIDRSANGVQSSAGARPTVVEQDGQVVTMAIRDVAETAYPSGRYQLVVYCLGAGTLYAHFSIGGSAAFEELPPCRPDGPTVTPVSLTVTKSTTRMVVGLVPAGATEAAVAYVVRKL